MVDLIKESFQIDVYNVIVSFMNVLLCLHDSLMCIPVWTETIAVITELHLEYRTDDLVNGLLKNTICNGWNAKQAFLPILFRDFYSQNSLSNIPAGTDSLAKVFQIQPRSEEHT